MVQAQLISLNKPTASTGVNAQLANALFTGETGECFYTELSDNCDAWWQVDLENTYNIRKIVIRNYVASDIYYHYYIRISLDGHNWSAPIAWKFDDEPAKECGDVYKVTGVGRFVRVSFVKNSANNSAHITNFEVYGEPISQKTSPAVSVEKVETDNNYTKGDIPKLTFSLENVSERKIHINNVYAIVFSRTGSIYRRFLEIASNITLIEKESYFGSALLWKIDEEMQPGNYDLFIRIKLNDGRAWESQQTSFTVSEEENTILYTAALNKESGRPNYTNNNTNTHEENIDKLQCMHEQKIREMLGKAAAGYVCDNNSIMLDKSITSQNIPMNIHAKNVLAVTHSIANLALSDSVRYYLIGGYYNPRLHGMYGVGVLERYSDFHFDIAFLGAQGISEKGAYCSHDNDVIIINTIKKISDRLILLIESTNFEKTGSFRIDVEGIDLLITDKKPPDEIMKALTKANVKTKIVNEIGM